MSFFAELRRRNVIRMAGLYLVGGWVVIQVAETLLPAFDIPAWVLRAIIIVIALGFIPALIFSWVFELTPEGLKRDTEVDRERSIAPQTGQRMNYMIAGLMAVALAYFAIDRFVVGPTRDALNVAASLKSRPPADPVVDPPVDAKSIAVLPFENLSGDKDNEYFASGMQDMILTKLAGIADLKVISRTSTEKYASHPDNLKTVAQQLGVATILEGSVQKSGNAVLINVQLIDAQSDVHLWAEAYPRTLENIFGVEGEVAQKIADALKAKLTSAESTNIASVSTRNPEAYDYYFKAEYLMGQAMESWDKATFLDADANFRKAIALDPDFALAHAKLAYCQLDRHWFSSGLSPAEMAETRQSIDRALALAPDLPDAHLALGYYEYWGFRRYDAATVEFKRTLELSPNNVEAINGLAFVARRTGHVEQAVTHLERVLTLAPRDARANTSLGETLAMLRRYTEADRWLTRSLAMAPADANAMDQLLQVRLFGLGDLAGARDAFRQPPDWRISGQRRWAGDVFFLINPRAYIHFFERRFDDALHDWDTAPATTDEERLAGRVARVAIRLVAGERDSLRSECAALEPLLGAELRRQPESLGLLHQSSWVEVCLGNKARAIATAKRAVEVLPLTKDGYFGAYQLSGLAQIAAHADAPDQAFEALHQLLAIPAGTIISVTRLRLDPVWDPLRRDPRFETLLKARAYGSETTEP
ncbi:tetratricopeptide repeat protein [Dokdonella immobilis]|uniref:TolB amino-terminal domain-containing protein n=1 Tax=Dokdonella immobilis TaxID=578942 RepID=A0A1I4VEP8_9GAMM|nr:tetratricopeptide repeat protein [Dokdonella immobilis]SFM99672.1 TolB amino-terminal domain-containing protein [Dokdonella immobilis]